jgi:thiamine-phosphate pyrophosphorylase
MPTMLVPAEPRKRDRLSAMTDDEHERAQPGGAGARRRERLGAARLYLVCPSRFDASPAGVRALERLIEEAVAGGVDVVQLRDKEIDDDRLTELARAAVALCGRLGALLIVNDRPRVALAAGADGVHVGQDDMPVAQARSLVGADMLIGLSTHAAHEVDAARPRAPDGGAAVDYIGVGPVHPTPTKPGRPAVGLELVRHAAAAAHVPFFAIGGLHAGNVDQVLDAGARAVCVLRAVSDADDPRRAARALRERIDARAVAGAR